LSGTSLTINGETRTIVAWARIGGLSYNTLFRRVQRGIDPAAAVFAPMHSKEAWKPMDDLPVMRPAKAPKRRREPVRFDVGPLLRWGSVRSVTFRVSRDLHPPSRHQGGVVSAPKEVAA